MVIFADNIECDVNNENCEHYCYNTAGSYYCICKTGYQLYFDRHKCIGNNNWVC